MANPIRPLDTSAENFVSGASAAVNRYEFGVKNPKRNWKNNTEAANERHKAAVIAANSRNAFLKGVQKVSQTDYQTATATKGVERYPSGVSSSKEKWAKGFQPYHSALGNMTLPNRGPRRSQENKNRMLANVKVMEDTFDALHK